MRHHLPARIAEGHPQDDRVLGADDRFPGLVAGGALGFGNQARHNDDPGLDVEALGPEAVAHLLFQGADLVQDVDHLSARIRTAQHVALAEVAVGRDDGELEDHGDPAQEPLQGGRLRGLQDVQQHLEGLAHPLCRVAPAGLEPQRLQGVAHLVPAGVGGVSFQQVVRVAQGPAQPAHVLDAVVEHQLHAVVLVDGQEVQQPLVALAELLEELAGESTVQELDPASDGAGLMEPGKFAVEGCQVHLQRPALLRGGSLGQSLLEAQEFDDLDLLLLHAVHMEAQVLPSRHVGAQGQVEPGTLHGRLLGGGHGACQPRVEQVHALIALRKALELVPQLGAQ